MPKYSICKLHNLLINNPWVKEEITTGLIKYLKLNDNERDISKPVK